MPKLSVSIPDELWEEAQGLIGPEKGTSQVIQDALRQIVAKAESRKQDLRAGLNIAPERFAAVVDVVRTRAKREFARGYATGLKIAETNDVDDWYSLAYEDWDINDWAKGYGTDNPDPNRQKALEDFAQEAEGEGSTSWPNQIFVEGAECALREVWKTLELERWGARAPSNSGTGDS